MVIDDYRWTITIAAQAQWQIEQQRAQLRGGLPHAEGHGDRGELAQLRRGPGQDGLGGG